MDTINIINEMFWYYHHKKRVICEIIILLSSARGLNWSEFFRCCKQIPTGELAIILVDGARKKSIDFIVKVGLEKEISTWEQVSRKLQDRYRAVNESISEVSLYRRLIETIVTSKNITELKNEKMKFIEEEIREIK